jgi:type I restriction-modification system DNA methylase subunit
MSISISDHFFDNPSLYGVSGEMIVSFQEPQAPSHLPYIDLLADDESNLPDAVIEVHGRPAMYLIRGEKFNYQNLPFIQDTLACRADARYLGIVEPGILKVFPIGLYSSKKKPSSIRKLNLTQGSTALHDFLIGGLGVDGVESNNRKRVSADAAWLDNYLLKLLQSTADNLRSSCRQNVLRNDQILSLVGRGLFARFIADRKIISDSDAVSICSSAQNIKSLFESPDMASETFAWLDRTFNGNLLPLIDKNGQSDAYKAFFNKIGFTAASRICEELCKIMHRAVDGQLSLGWQRIRFQHVPADMLSQVYEHFAHKFQKKYAEQSSVHYTPRHIAQVLIDAAFSGLEIEDKSRAKILDPAVGGGVFLVLAFKRLVQELWRKNNRRPNRSEIRKILNNQLCGLDINQEALRFSALSLYLTALELDPKPAPLSELRFDDLSTKSLLHVGEKSVSQSILNLGSLSPSLTQSLNNKFDIVIGNPPWTRLGDAGNQLTALVRRLAAERGVSPQIVEQLDNKGAVPDIPFIWKAIEWAKPNGMIAYALHAQHLLFRQGNGAVMRRALFESIEITGIMNGSAIRSEKAIWPTITAPFCFLLARNRKPREHSAFYYLSPLLETSINQNGRFRLDPQSAFAVEQQRAITSQYLFKALYRGTMLDLSIVECLTNNPNTLPLADYWRKLKLKNGEGFQVVEKKGDKNSAIHLHGKKVLEHEDVNGYQLDISSLPDFNYEFLHRPRDRRIYDGPLVLFRESPKKERQSRGGLLAMTDVVYRKSFIGYSCATHPNGKLLARYLQLISYSDVFIFVALMFSSKFGVERDSVQKEDVDQFPIIPLEKLDHQQQLKVAQLSEELINGQNPWNEIDEFVASLYELTESDMQVVRDTLAHSLPYTDTQTQAQAVPSNETLIAFVSHLSDVARPFAKRLGLGFDVDLVPNNGFDGWRFVCIKRSQNNHNSLIDHASFISQLASNFWASQIRIFPDSHTGNLYVGQLAQNRYWTKTRARILALDLIDADFYANNNSDRSLN